MLKDAAGRQWWRRLELWLVVAASLALFSYLQPLGTLADPDAFYHARLTVLMRDTGLVRAFPWTQSSLYKTIFIDHHFGYHLLLIPWVSIGSPLQGLQFATIVFATFTIAVLAWLMRRWRVPLWGLGVLLLLTAGPFIFRLSLGKAPAIGVGVAIVGYYLIMERKLGWLFWWAWGFTWLYSAWPLLPVMAVLFVLVSALRYWREGWGRVWGELWQGPNVKLIGAVAAGCVAGLVINPYFPTNLLYLKQLFTMALVAYNKFIGVGGEWYPYNVFDLLRELSYPLLIWALATIAGVFWFKKQTDVSRTTWLMALIFLVYTLRARRQVEYLTPFLVLSAGLIVRDCGLSWANLRWRALWERFSTWRPPWLNLRSVQIALVGYFLLVVPWGLARGVGMAHYYLRQGFKADSLAPASQWLAAHSAPGTIIFQTDWGSFPLLFYHNTRDYYLTGLDQTFMYVYDQDRFWQWVNLTTGERLDAYHVVHDTFGASYVLVERRVPAILRALHQDQRFRQVYSDQETLIYSL